MINNISVTNTITIRLNNKIRPTELTTSEALELRDALNVALNESTPNTTPYYPPYYPPYYQPIFYEPHDNDIWCSKTSSADTRQFHTY